MNKNALYFIWIILRRYSYTFIFSVVQKLCSKSMKMNPMRPCIDKLGLFYPPVKCLRPQDCDPQNSIQFTGNVKKMMIKRWKTWVHCHFFSGSSGKCLLFLLSPFIKQKLFIQNISVVRQSGKWTYAAKMWRLSYIAKRRGLDIGVEFNYIFQTAKAKKASSMARGVVKYFPQRK